MCIAFIDVLEKLGPRLRYSRVVEKRCLRINAYEGAGREETRGLESIAAERMVLRAAITTPSVNCVVKGPTSVHLL